VDEIICFPALLSTCAGLVYSYLTADEYANTNNNHAFDNDTTYIG
jgi:hypothetical protein